MKHVKEAEAAAQELDQLTRAEFRASSETNGRQLTEMCEAVLDELEEYAADVMEAENKANGLRSLISAM